MSACLSRGRSRVRVPSSSRLRVRLGSRPCERASLRGLIGGWLRVPPRRVPIHAPDR